MILHQTDMFTVKAAEHNDFFFLAKHMAPKEGKECGEIHKILTLKHTP